jgi:hypothetical protein
MSFSSTKNVFLSNEPVSIHSAPIDEIDNISMQLKMKVVESQCVFDE